MKHSEFTTIVAMTGTFLALFVLTLLHLNLETRLTTLEKSEGAATSEGPTVLGSPSDTGTAVAAPALPKESPDYLNTGGDNQRSLNRPKPPGLRISLIEQKFGPAEIEHLDDGREIYWYGNHGFAVSNGLVTGQELRGD